MNEWLCSIAQVRADKDREKEQFNTKAKKSSTNLPSAMINSQIRSPPEDYKFACF